MRKLMQDIGRYYNEMNRYSIWVLGITMVIGLILLVGAVVIPHTALPATNPALALDLIDQCREAGFGVLTVGLLLSFVGDVIVKYDHIEL